MDSRAPAVVAVVVTTGNGPGLEATLTSIVAQDYEEMSLLVVANGDAEHVAERVATVAPEAFVRVLEENHGFGAACNEATLMVEGSAFFLFCHDDVRLEPDAVHCLVEAAFRTNAAIVSPKVVRYDDPLVLVHVGQTCDRFGAVRERVELGEIDHGQQDLERDVFVAPGGVTLVRADLFASLRGFDPLITVLGEDLDLCWRAQVAGARVVVAPSAVVAHRETIASGERPVGAVGTRRASRQDLQRRHQILTVATGWTRPTAMWTLLVLAGLDVVESIVALAGRDVDRAGAIAGSWRWLLGQHRAVRARRRFAHSTRVLTDAQLRRLQVGGASRLRQFLLTLLRDGYDRARGILPAEADVDVGDDDIVGVGFAAAFVEGEEFDDLVEEELFEHHARPSRFLTSFRSQAAVIAVAFVLWLIGSRNLVAMHLPLVGRLAPLDSWWSTWRHFFASWSPNGVGTGSPGAPGYGLLAFAGTFVVGRMGILPRLALIFSVPLGGLGLSRFVKGRVSNRARVVGVLAYAAAPVGLNMIGQGRVDVLAAVAGLPFIVRRIFELMDVAGFRTRPYGEAVPFGHRGWRVSEAGQRMSLIMVTALVTAFAPATLVVAAIVVVGVVIARWLEPDEGHGSVPAARFLGSLAFNVAIFLLPLTIDVVAAGRRAPDVFGLVRGPWSAPGFSMLLRGVDGTFGASWWGWLLPLAALFGFVLCRGERRRVASKVLVIAALTLVVATFVSRHWLGSFSPDLDVLLALYDLMIAVLIALGVSALEHDLRAAGFGWRQAVAGLSVVTLIAAALPLLASFASGRFELPTSSVAQSLTPLAATTPGGYRILWLGDPAVLPVAGWSIAPGLAAATSLNGLPGGATAFTPPDSSTSDVVLKAVHLAMAGQTVELGRLLASAGIATIVEMSAAAPEITDVERVPVHRVPRALSAALAAQDDLALELHTNAVVVYTNASFSGVTSTTSTSAPAPVPVFSARRFAGTLAPSTTLVAGLAPASAFRLVVGTTGAARATSPTWAAAYHVGTTGGHGTLDMRRFPLNGLIALVTLLMWSIVWLGFGWIERLEWLFTGRRRRGSHRDRRG